MSKQQTKSASVRFKYGRHSKAGWLGRVRRALQEDARKRKEANR